MKLTKKEYEGIVERVEANTATDDDRRLYKHFGGKKYLEGDVPSVAVLDDRDPTFKDAPPADDVPAGTDVAPPVKETEHKTPKDDNPMPLRPSLG